MPSTLCFKIKLFNYKFSSGALQHALIPQQWNAHACSQVQDILHIKKFQLFHIEIFNLSAQVSKMYRVTEKIWNKNKRYYNK